MSSWNVDAGNITTIATGRGESRWSKPRYWLKQIRRKVQAAILRPILRRDPAGPSLDGERGSRPVRSLWTAFTDRFGLFLMDSGSDPLRLIGAGILGAAAQWLFNRAVKKSFPPQGPDNKRVLQELKHIREQIQLMQGDFTGLKHRVEALERGGSGD